MKQLTKIFRSLGNDRRLEILKILLSEKELSVIDISEKIKLSFRSTSKHLLKLENIGVLKRRETGRYTFYSVNEKILSRYLSPFKEMF
ncbi:MAG: ArsR/SmtB family transcription factor [Patescibacteria group bacterium]